MSAGRPPIRLEEIARPLALAVVVAVVFVGPEAFTGIDPAAVARALLDGALPYRDVPLEYPPGGALVLMLPGILDGILSYRTAFRAFMAIAWGALAWLVAREARGEPEGDAILSRFLLASIAYAWILVAMYDVVLALLAFAAWRAARRGRTEPSAAWLGLGVLVKWFTAPLAPLLLERGKARALAIAGAILVVCAAASTVLPAAVADEGDDPLTFHRGRLLHAESTLGSAIVVSRLVAGEDARIVDDHRSSGLAGVGSWARIATLVAALGVAMLVWVRGDRRAASSWGAVLLAIPALGPVASPQFLLWPLGFAGWWPGPARRLYVATGIAALAYTGLIDDLPAAHGLPATVMLVRNVLAIATLATLVRASLATGSSADPGRMLPAHR